MIAAKEKKNQQIVATSSLADIAFLLLIFFLIGATIDADKGIPIMLPGAVQKNVSPKNVYTVQINAFGEVGINGTSINMEMLGRQAEKIQRKNDKAIFSIRADENANYQTYITVLDQLKMAGVKRISITQS